MDPGYFPTYVKRSWVYQNQHNYNAAFNDLAYAIQLSPYYTDAYIERALLWIQVGRPQDAIKDISKAQQLEPASPQIAQYKAYCLSMMKIK